MVGDSLGPCGSASSRWLPGLLGPCRQTIPVGGGRGHCPTTPTTIPLRGAVRRSAPPFQKKNTSPAFTRPSIAAPDHAPIFLSLPQAAAPCSPLSGRWCWRRQRAGLRLAQQATLCSTGCGVTRVRMANWPTRTPCSSSACAACGRPRRLGCAASPAQDIGQSPLSWLALHPLPPHTSCPHKRRR